MAINLEKGQRINLEKSTGAKLTNFCVGCNWGAVTKTETIEEKSWFRTTTKEVVRAVDVDLDLSCLMFNAAGEVVDHIYSEEYKESFLNKFGCPNGKFVSRDRALHHSGDDKQGDQNGDDGLDNEIITVDLNRVNPNINSIVFFLNIFNNGDFNGDFSEIPYAYIRMYEGTAKQVNSVFAQYNVATKGNCRGMRALVMGKLYRHNGDWKFSAIGDAFEDRVIVQTVARVIRDYNK